MRPLARDEDMNASPLELLSFSRSARLPSGMPSFSPIKNITRLGVESAWCAWLPFQRHLHSKFTSSEDDRMTGARLVSLLIEEMIHKHEYM